MKIVIDIPKEFEEHFKVDRFEDSLARIASDIESFGFQFAGRYEQETITMLREAIKNGTPLPKGHKVIDAYVLQEHLAIVPMEDRTYREAVEIIDRFPSIIEVDEESD